ncbi:MAG: glycosyltransferase family 4 protein [Flavobacteriia bacterium]|nr:glycosyltransferase family 4 protein [Flavobacteriia bacterium]
MTKNRSQKLLIIGTVWPEPNSSAAGWRMLNLISIFKNLDFEIIFACSASESTFSFPLENLNIKKQLIQLNNDHFNDFVKEINPSVVLFDRFMIEEQYGWRVAEHCPNALRIIDTEDLHCLRAARQLAFKEKREFTFKDLNSEIAKREIASILRSDCSLIISEFEMEILKNHFKIDESLLYYLPFMFPAISVNETTKLKTFEERKHLVFIGNFYHEPNWDAVLYLKKEIWPKLSKLLPNTNLQIFGAYSSPKVLQLNNPKERFFCLGRAENAQEIISNAKILIAPLRFGAGLKGKLAEAMLYGTPSITTSIGSEGMNGNYPWNGGISDDYHELINAAYTLYTNEEKWKKAQQNGFEIINNRFNIDTLIPSFNSFLSEIIKNKVIRRESNFIGQLLMHHTLASTKYLSKWIMEKNKS